MTENTEGRAFDWDDQIENDSAGGDFVTLPAGEYAFEVVHLARERHTPNPTKPGKLPECNKAVVELHFEGFAEGQTISENLFLHTRCEGILCAFFTSIGQRKHGEQLKPNWGGLVGAKGRAKLAVREYEKDGKSYTINQVKQYLDPVKADGAGFTPGQF